jgi:hypothetical protein
MTMNRTPWRLTAASGLLAAALLAACKAKEQPPPTTVPPTTAAPTTTTTTTTTVPSPPPVWGAAHWGMTKDEVLAAFPGQAQKLPQPVEFGPQMPGSSDVAIPAYEMDGATYRVLFGFEGEALNRIQLALGKAGYDTCTDLEKRLTERHSAPADKTSAQANVRTETIVWKAPDQTITLVCTESRALGFRSVTLDHRPPSKT